MRDEAQEEAFRKGTAEGESGGGGARFAQTTKAHNPTRMGSMPPIAVAAEAGAEAENLWFGEAIPPAAV